MAQVDEAKQQQLARELGIDINALRADEQPLTSQQMQQAMDVVGAPVPQPRKPGVLDFLAPYVPTTVEMAGTIEGMRKGAQAGRVLGTPGMVGGAIAGAVLGRSTGETLSDLMASRPFDPVGNIEKGLEAGVFASGGEVAGTAIAKGLQAIRTLRAGKTPTPDELDSIKKLQNELSKFRDKNGKPLTLTPNQIMQSPLQSSFERIALSGFGGKTKIRNLYEAQADFLLNRLETMIPDLGNASRVELGEAVKKVITEGEEQLIAWARPKYAELDVLGAQTPVVLNNLTDFIKTTKSTAKEGRKAQSGTRLDPEVNSLLLFLNGEKKNNNFKSQFELLSRLSSDLRKAKTRRDPNTAYETALVKAMDNIHADLDSAAADVGGDLYTKYKDVSTIYRESMTTLQDDALRGLADMAPEFVGETIYKQGNVTAIQKAFNAIDERVSLAQRSGEELPDKFAEDLKNQLRAGYFDALITPVQMQESSIKTAQQLLDQVNANVKIRDTFNTLFSSKQKTEIRDVLKWGARMEKENAGNFSLIVRGRQSGEFNKLSTIALQGSSLVSAGPTAGLLDPTIAALPLAVVMSPYFLARRATNGTASQKLLDMIEGKIKRFNANEFGIRDTIALLNVLADSKDDDMRVPEPMYIEGLTPSETYRHWQRSLELGLPIQDFSQ